MPRLTVIKTAVHPSELYIAKSYLEDNDIPCFIKNELAMQVSPIYSDINGGARLQVPEEYAEKAIQLLVEGGFAEKADYEIPESTQKLVKLQERVSSLFGGKNK